MIDAKNKKKDEKIIVNVDVLEKMLGILVMSSRTNESNLE